MEHLFSYGTLQLPAVQREIFGCEIEGQADALVGFRKTMVEITEPHVLALSGERFHPIVSRTNAANYTVPGMVFSLSPEQLARADAYEVEDYHRALVTLQSGRTAWLYVETDK